MKFVELRPFAGRALEDVVRYLRSDVPKAFSDLFAGLGTLKLAESYQSATSGAFIDFDASGIPEDVVTLTLNPGEWTVFGSMQFDPNGATGDLVGDMWLTTLPTNPAYTSFSVDRTQIQIANVATYAHGLVHRRFVLGSRSNVYLSAAATYTGGPIKRIGSIWALGRQ